MSDELKPFTGWNELEGALGRLQARGDAKRARVKVIEGEDKSKKMRWTAMADGNWLTGANGSIRRFSSNYNAKCAALKQIDAIDEKAKP
jgi:hypothetical protein